MKVVLDVTRNTYYSKVVDMTPEEFQEYESLLYSRDSKTREKLNAMIRPDDDWIDDDCERVEISEFTG